MKLFISWSGPTSRAIASMLREWLPNVLQAVEPWTSEADIEPGARWLQDLSEELKGCNFGILCVTPDNVVAPWLLFEAGALSKSIEQSRVCPVLWNMRPADLDPPLGQFQAIELLNKASMLSLVRSINGAAEDSRLEDARVVEAFDVWWARLEAQLEQVGSQDDAGAPRRTDRDLLEEILGLVRHQSRQQAVSPISFLSRGQLWTALRPSRAWNIYPEDEEVDFSELAEAARQFPGGVMEVLTSFSADGRGGVHMITREPQESGVVMDYFHGLGFRVRVGFGEPIEVVDLR